MQGERVGLVQVYTGEGKGKTTAAFGLALRAAGRGLRVKVIQFLKGRESGEVIAARRLGIEVAQFGGPGWVDLKNPAPSEHERAAQALAAAREALGAVDLLVLDEANVALAAGLLQVEEVLELLEGRPQGVEVVLTGRRAPVELVARADLVTEMLAIKHPYAEGVSAREGIEY
jgi:cob(I)alamin adenosyltransferase